MDIGLDGEQVFWIVLGGVAGVVIVAAIFGEYLTARTKTRAKTQQSLAREESRREIAAYVAEGSMSPDDAAKILAADMPVWERGFQKKG
ncbi:MAG: hypothetical protein Q9O74_02470 [Planctomycetota bacterium]|nr:hypothetical protein [Planctomycetota bacterium]